MTSRQDRAKSARETINKKIPALLASDARARAGVQNSSLLKDIQPLSGPASSPPEIEVWHTDTISAALQLHTSASGRTAILNMASPLRPGGGVLTGATSQEEFLCYRTTLYPSLKDEFYRIPETGLIYTKDVLIFRDATGDELAKRDRIYVDVVTGAMLRFPDLVEKDGQQTWAEEKDRELVIVKMRAVLRTVIQHGNSRVVLGAWGCGAYANPTNSIAKCWKLVLSNGKKENWSGLTKVVFAITNADQVGVFKTEFSL